MPPPELEVRVLGPLEVVHEGRPVALGPPMQRAVLALLAIEPGRVVSVDVIADELWGDSPPPTFANTLQVYVSRLRKALGAATIATRPPGYVLALPPDAVDRGRFEDLTARARELLDGADPHAATESFTEALDLWRGPAFADVADVSACEREAARLDEARVQALEDRVEADLACGRHARVAAEVPSLLAQHPLRERLYAHLMLALYRCGRQADALGRYAELREILSVELGVDPGPEVQRLEQAILLQKPELDWTPPMPPAAPVPVPPSRSVPEPVTTFVGREREREDLVDMLASSRLITLTGAGGCGKTRLALELAREFEHAWFVDLSTLTDPALVAQQAAAAIGMANPSGTDALAARLRPFAGLVILDNCEHLLEPSARLAHELISGCPYLSVVATSREPLRAGGESVYRIRPLPVPGVDDPQPLSSDSARLFCDRARAADAAYVAESQAESIADVVRRLDGIPLAIELAAARSAVLTPAEIAARLDDALGLLSGGAVTDVPHHRTMRAALEWSQDALSESQRILLRRLGVFTGSFTIADAEAVCGNDVLDDVSRLVGLALLETADVGAVKRFTMLEPVRQYAYERLEESGEATEWRTRHLHRMTALAAGTRDRITGPEQAEAAAELDENTANFRAALSWALDDQADTAAGVRLAADLSSYWMLRGHLAEARRWLESALSLGAGDDRTQLAARIALGGVCAYQGDLSASTSHMQLALEVARATGDVPAEGRALINLGAAAVMQGDLDTAHDHLSEAVDAARGAEDLDLAMRALVNLAQVVRRRGDLDAARALYEEALEAAQVIENPMGSVTALLNLADIDRATDRTESARSLYEDALDGARRLNFAAGIATALGGLGNLAREEGDLAGARHAYTESVEVATRSGHMDVVVAGVGNLAAVAEEEGDLDEARKRYEEYRTMSKRVGDPRGVARARRGLADVLRARGDLRRAERFVRAALESARGLGEPDEVITCLESVAALAWERGEPGLAGRFLGAAQRGRRELGTYDRGRARIVEDLVAHVDPVEIAPDDAAAEALRWLGAGVRPFPTSA